MFGKEDKRLGVSLFLSVSSFSVYREALVDWWFLFIPSVLSDKKEQFAYAQAGQFIKSAPWRLQLTN